MALSENYEIAYFRLVKNLLQHPLGRLRKNGLPLTGRYKSMLAKRSPIQVLTARRAA